MKPCAFLLALGVLGAALTTAALPDDWPTWRGPSRDGHCRETGLLAEWPPEGPPLAWKATGLGVGYSGPAVVGNVLYTMGNVARKETVLAVSTENGELLWSVPFGPVEYDYYAPGTRATPTIDGGRLYAQGASGQLACIDLATRRILWSRNFVNDFGGTVPKWGFAESPLVDGDWLVSMPGGPRASVAALDKLTGKTVWAAPLGDLASYSSLVAATIGGVKQYVGFSADSVLGVDARDGTLLWRYTEPDHTDDWGDVNVMTPVVSEGTVYASSNYETGGGKARIVKTSDGFTAEQVFFNNDLENHHGGVVLVDGYLYGCDEPGLLTCMDHATGEVRWQARKPGKCSVLYAEGRLYCRDEKGPVSLVEATPEEFRLRGHFKQPDRSKQRAWPHPVIAHGRLYIRDQDVILCYNVRAEAEEESDEE